MGKNYSGIGGLCPVKSKEVSAQLCRLHYPFCRSCRKHYKRWMREELEVQGLENENKGEKSEG